MFPVSNLNQNGLKDRSNDPSITLNLTGPPTMVENHLLSDENLPNINVDDAVVKINQLMTENVHLKQTIQQTNASMKMACESFAALKQKAISDEEEHTLHYNKSRTVVMDLRRKVVEQEKIIEKLKQQINQDANDLVNSDQMKRLQLENDQLMQESHQLRSKLANQEVPLDEMRSLKSQLANLLGVQEVMKQQYALEKKSLQERCMNLEKDLKQQQMNKSDEQRKIENLQTENNRLSTELKSVSKNYEQLMSDYHDLLESNDEQKYTQNSQATMLKKDFEDRLDNLTAQLVTAEEVLIRKEEQVKTLEQKLKDVETLQVQVDIYKSDFEAERKSREELNDRYLELRDKCEWMEKELGKSPAILAEIWRRHGQHTSLLTDPQSYRKPSSQVPVPVSAESTTEVEQFKCPLCGYCAPDYDSLTLHVNECIK